MLDIYRSVIEGGADVPKQWDSDGLIRIASGVASSTRMQRTKSKNSNSTSRDSRAWRPRRRAGSRAPALPGCTSATHDTISGSYANIEGDFHHTALVGLTTALYSHCL